MNLPSNKFYLGKIYDLAKSKLLEEPVLYDPADLTTHGVIVGMTGSGKTGLGISLLEEAALQGIPALIIDPKGDVANLLLHFPDLAPADFAPWVDAEQAGREGKTPAQAAEDAAALWKKGLADWGIAPDRIRALQRAVQFAVYTPGSEAGLPVNVVASLEAPDVDWASNREALRDKISSTVAAIFSLVGVTEIDPLKSREHILLSNILEAAWSAGKGLTLENLILQVQTPPFSKLGVFDVESFYPSRDRQALAMQLNNVLAAPTFQPWVMGQPLVIDALLHTPDGRPRHCVFSIAHLSETERMFFVTLLLSAVDAWMRTRSGSSSLRALVYFDEIVGYLPPVANPPSKTVFLRLFKQARAFGVGVLVATQNPVDLDYKALSNAGTWFIGRLQTDQDKQHLLDGLEMPGVSRGGLDKTLSQLSKRLFLMNNVHAKRPVIFQSRWAMNYLPGPLTRAQIPALNKLVGATLPAGSAVSATGVRPAAAVIASASAAGVTHPAVPAGVAEYFLPQNVSLQQAAQSAGRSAPASVQPIYRPALIAQARVRFLERKYRIDQTEARTVLVLEPDRRGVIRWQDFPASAVDAAALPKTPAAGASFAALEPPLSDGKILKPLEKDFLDWILHEAALPLRVNEALGVAAGPEVSAEEFQRRCADAAARSTGGAKAKALAALDKRLATLREKLAKEERELQQDQSEVTHRAIEEATTAADTIFGLFTGRSRRLTTSLTKRRLTAKAAGDASESRQVIDALKKQIAALEQERVAAAGEVSQSVQQTVDIRLTPARKDVYVDLFGVAWVPYYRAADGAEFAAYTI